jgi:hypothetical protein
LTNVQEFTYDLDMTRDELIGELGDEAAEHLGRPLVSRPWQASEVTVDGDRLTWRPQPGTIVTPSRDLLEEFLRLTDAPDAAILRFAKRWGPLGLCKHGFPSGHPGLYWPSRPLEAHACPHDPRIGDSCRCTPRGFFEGREWEPLAEWRVWSRRVRATLEYIAALQQDKVPSEAAWRTAFLLGDVPTAPGYPELPRTVAAARGELQYYLGYWLSAAAVRLFVDVGRRPTLTWGSNENPVFGALAIQLALIATGKWGLALCDGCGASYPPSRHPRPNTRHYCLACRDRQVPQRDAARAYRAKRRTKRKAKGR